MAASISFRRAMDAVASIGDDAPPWSDILSASRDLVGADSASLMMIAGNGDLLHVSHTGIADSTVQAYQRYYHKLDMMTHVAMHQDAGCWLDSDEALPRQVLRHSEFYNEYLVPHGHRQILALMLERNERGIKAMAFQRSSVEEYAVDRLSTGETGIFVRAFQGALHAKQTAIARDIRVLDDTLGAMGEAICLVNANGGIVHVSPLCADLLDSQSGRRRGQSGGLQIRQGRLYHPTAAIGEYVLGTIATTLRTSQRTRAVVGMSLGETLTLDITAAPARWKLAAEPLALIRLRLTRADSELDPATLVAVFNITPAEARVLASLAAGHSPADCARESGVSENTVRSQIASLKSKLHCGRIVDLVRLARIAQ